jgi:hypothetical protein
MVWRVVGGWRRGVTCGYFVAEGIYEVYDSLICAVHDAWDPRYKVLYMPVDDCWCRFSQLMEGEGIRLVG